MRALSDLAELVRVGRRNLGEEWWLRGGELGHSIYKLDDPAHVPAYAGLHEEAHLWIHRDYDHDAWHVLDVDEPREVGADFVMMTRRPGVTIRMFYPDATDDPVPPPEDRLRLLHEVVDKLRDAAGNDLDRFLANLVRDRVRARNAHVLYASTERRFYLDDLDPTAEELTAWRAVTASAPALTSSPIAWEHTGDGELPYRARLGGRALAIRVNDFPAEPLYTLLADGQELADLDDWPAGWDKPAPPPHLLDLAARAQGKKP